MHRGATRPMIQSWYDRTLLPHIIRCACANPEVSARRRLVVPRATGRVLELGIGGGLNLVHYDPARVTTVVGVDPSAELRAMALASPRSPGLTVRIEDGTAEQLPFADAGFDTVVCTFTLCSVANPERALAEARRVLRPGGWFLFCEHGAAPDAAVGRWQRRLEPLWKRIAGGCHLTRPISASIAHHFTLDQVESGYLPKAPRPLGWNEWGSARAA